MKKYSKDQIQKGVLVGIFAVALLYVYFSMLLGPLTRAEANARTGLAELAPKIEEARKQLSRTRNIEQNAPGHVASLDAINSLIPAGAPVAWFPPRMTEFFRRHGVEKVATRLANETGEKDLPGYRSLFWSIDLPRVESVGLAIALAGLENDEPLVEIKSVQIDTVADDVQHQRALLNVSTIAKQ